MAIDKKEIAMWTFGTLATIVVAFLIYRLQKNDAAQNAQTEADASAAAESQLANQQAEAASLPSISVPSISATPSTTDTSNQSQTPAIDPTLAALLVSALSEDNSSITSSNSPSGSAIIPPLVLPPSPGPVQVNNPNVNNFSGGGGAVTYGQAPTDNTSQGAPLVPGIKYDEGAQ